MGQTTVDLPDPMEGRPAGGGAGASAGADDLLDQLAVDEIDRLLAGVEADPAPPSHASPPGRRARGGTAAGTPSPGTPAADAPSDHPHPPRRPAPPSPDNAPASAVTQTGGLAEATYAEESTADAAVEADSTTNSRADGAEDGTAPAGLERLFHRFDGPAAAEPLPEPPNFDAAVGEAGSVIREDEDAATALAERDALDEVAADAVGGEVGPEDEAGAVPDRGDGDDEAAAEPLPLYLRPLEWLNAPLDALPGSAREAVGKIAIMVLVNALAVLLYVLLFLR